MYIIQCHQVNLAFNTKTIFDKLSFKIDKGSKACICGPSGAGKTSLLKMLMGILQPNAGVVTINSADLRSSNINIIRKEIAWLPQNINLPVNSGKELSLLLNQSERQQKQIPVFMNMLGLSPELYYRDIHQISGGQKQRILLAVCMSLNKPILLLDEPTSALDDHTSNLLMDTLWAQHDLTVLAATHHKPWIERCTQIINL